MYSDSTKSMLANYSKLISNFGNLNQFLDLYSSLYINDYALYKLTQFQPKDVFILNNQLYKYNLLSVTSNFNYEDSILLEFPYQVLNIKGELLYSVSDHKGIFGNSLYDHYLIQNSNQLQFYILSYKTYVGEKQKLLVVDNVQDVVDPIDFTTEMSIENNVVEQNKDKNVVYINSLTKEPFVFYYLPKPISNFISADLIKINPLVEIYNSTNGMFSFSPTESGWFLITKNEIDLDSLTYNGNGLERFLRPFDNEVYYLFIGNVFNRSFLRRTAGITKFNSSNIQLNISI